jgi:hypothetical protein
VRVDRKRSRFRCTTASAFPFKSILWEISRPIDLFALNFSLISRLSLVRQAAQSRLNRIATDPLALVPLEVRASGAQSIALPELHIVRSIFVVAPNLISADKISRKLTESPVRSVLRCHKPCEIGRVGAYFDHLWPNRKRRRTRWRSGMDSNSRCRCPTRGKLYRNSHFGTHFAPKNPKVFRAFFGVQIPSARHLLRAGRLKLASFATSPAVQVASEQRTQ